MTRATKAVAYIVAAQHLSCLRSARMTGGASGVSTIAAIVAATVLGILARRWIENPRQEIKPLVLFQKLAAERGDWVEVKRLIDLRQQEARRERLDRNPRAAGARRKSKRDGRR